MDDDRVSVDDFNAIPQTEEWLRDHVHIVPLSEFITTEEENAEPLLGTNEETLLPAGGMMLMYGDGGAGKTTLTIDAVCHLAAGTPWLSVPVERPVHITLIENEGPRGKFRQMLREKAAAWNGKGSFVPNVQVLEEPWTRFTLRDEAHRNALALHVTDNETDIVIMGPLATLGMVGGGTPDEINEFESLLGSTRSLIPRPVAFWVIHHENKAGDVSGAWERVPDTLVHVQAQGNGHTRLVWRKARWASAMHGTNLDLVWIDGRSYEVKTTTERDLYAEIKDAGSEKWLTVPKYAALVGANKDRIRETLEDLHERGEFEFSTGPRGAKLYRPRPGSDTPSQVEPVDSLGGAGTDLARLAQPDTGASRAEPGRVDPPTDLTQSEPGRVIDDEELERLLNKANPVDPDDEPF